MALILYECALHRFRQKPQNWTSLIKVIFKFISALKQWLVCTTFFAIIPLHLRTHSLKNYSLTFLHAFTLIFSTLLPTNTLRMKNQFIQSIRNFLHFIPMIRLTFPKNFLLSFLYFFMQLQNCYHKDGHSTYKSAAGRERPTTRKRPRRPYIYYKATGVGEQLQLFSTFGQSPRREQPDPLQAVERG